MLSSVRLLSSLNYPFWLYYCQPGFCLLTLLLNVCARNVDIFIYCFDPSLTLFVGYFFHLKYLLPPCFYYPSIKACPFFFYEMMPTCVLQEPLQRMSPLIFKPRRPWISMMAESFIFLCHNDVLSFRGEEGKIGEVWKCLKAMKDCLQKKLPFLRPY